MLFVYINWHVVKRIFKISFYMLPIGVVCAGFYFDNREPQILIERVKVEVPSSSDNRQKEFENALKTIPKQMGVSDIVVETILDKEEVTKNLNAFRSEADNPKQMAIARKFTKNEAQAKMIASSHCPFQVMGYEAEQRGVAWAELYYPKTCVEIAMVVWLSKRELCMKQNPHLKNSKLELLACTAKRYNGDGEKAEKYKVEFMAILAGKLVKKYGEEAL
jgi:hypothetical protein